MLPRTCRQRSSLTKSMDAEDLAQLGTQLCPNVMLPRTWRQRSSLMKRMDTEDLALFGDLECVMLCSQEPGGKDPRSWRAWTQRTWLDWEPRKPHVMLPRTFPRNFSHKCCIAAQWWLAKCLNNFGIIWLLHRNLVVYVVGSEFFSSFLLFHFIHCKNLLKLTFCRTCFTLHLIFTLILLIIPSKSACH